MYTQSEQTGFADVLSAEREQIARRRACLKLQDAVPEAPPLSPSRCIGLALSGGGIRSATFSLGVLQALARKRLLQRFDYLSTVSGGSYIGCYFGSLFLPETLRQHQNRKPEKREFEAACESAYAAIVEASAGADATEKTAAAADSKGHWSGAASITWLRENGRYLTPGGAGDLLFAIAMQIRNWFAVQYVVGIAMLFSLLSFATARAWMTAHWQVWRVVERGFLPGPGDMIYWSPGWALVGAVALIFVVPPGLAYWFVHTREKRDALSWVPLWHEIAALFGVLLTLCWAYAVIEVRGIAGSLGEFAQLPFAFWMAAGYVVVSIISIACFLAGWCLEKRSLTEQGLQSPSARYRAELASLRTRFTQWLRWTFQLLLIAAGLATLGTIGQTLYAYLYPQQGSLTAHLLHLLAAIAALSASVVAAARQVFKLTGSKKSEKYPMIPVDLIAGVAAVVLLLLTGTVWSTLVQSALWTGGPPPALPHEIGGAAAGPYAQWGRINEIIVSAWGIPGTSWSVLISPSGGQTVLAFEPVVLSLGWITLTWVAVGFLFVTTGWFLNFLNMSSLHQLYAARLTRAYLGATNRERFGSKPLPVTAPVASDAIGPEEYYHEDLIAPVHLLNVTINRTRPMNTELVQRHRRGVPMSLGPRHTLVNGIVLRREASAASTLTLNSSASFFGTQHKPGEQLHTEDLSLGDWCAISGAAFSTGLGIRTSLGLSLLAGLANVRLGYWWNARAHLPESSWKRVFAAYRYLWGELMADFKGTELPYWFLTDGGHFENTAAYELIRRRVGIIVMCDNGCDPEYGFEDLGNLARKIRMDFGAQMCELSAEQLRQIMPTGPSGSGQSAAADLFSTADGFASKRGRKGKCALLFKITYTGSPDHSLLIVLKPNMIADVPVDVEQYAWANSAFPNQTTLDQFFDDAQWESYRMLGDCIATRVIDDDALRFAGWHAKVATLN